MSILRRSWLIIAVISVLGGFLLGGGWFLSACQHACLTPADCGGLLCGPGRICVVRCFAGQTDGCPTGTLCNNKGDGCNEIPTSSTENVFTESGLSEPTNESTSSEISQRDAGHD